MPVRNAWLLDQARAAAEIVERRLYLALYHTALLGPRPDHPTGTADWDRRVRAVEAWRHHHLGLHGQAAVGLDAPPSDQALGPAPDDAIQALARRRILDRSQGTFDLGVSR